jgi:hypothetical protein
VTLRLSETLGPLVDDVMEEPIAVRPHPFRQTFDSFEAAVAQAFVHPLRFDAQRDAERLAGARLVDGFWALSEWHLRFSNRLSLRIWVPETEVRWCLGEELAEPSQGPVSRVGSLPVRLRWPEPLGVLEMDCSALLAKRRGAVFQNLHVNHTGLYLYFHGHLIFEFHAAFRVADGGNILYVSEDE